MMQLETERLILRLGRSTRPTPDEIEAGYKKYVVEHEDPDCTFEVYSDEVMFSYIRGKRGSQFGYYNLILKEENREIGHCNFGPTLCIPEVVALFDSSGDSANLCSSVEIEIGWSISKFYRKKGYATEGARALIEYGFKDLKLRRIVAFTDLDNIASVRVIERLGMKLRTCADNRNIVGITENTLLRPSEGQME